MLERILDMAADELDIDPAELRRRNFLQPDEFPYSTVTGVTYDVGDYDAALTEALRIADYDALRAEQAARRERGDVKQLGIGLCAYVEITSGGMPSEYSEVEIHADGTATVKAGTSATDRATPPRSRSWCRASSGSRSRTSSSCSPTPPSSPGAGARVVRARCRSVGARCSRRRAWCSSGRATSRPICSRPRPRTSSSPTTARSASPGCRRRRSPGRRWPPRRTTTGRRSWSSTTSCRPARRSRSVPTCRWSRSTCETGRVEPVRHIAVDDCGRILNPMLVDGQVHGGLASGIGQALWEHMVYDDDGNPLTSTLAEYGIPSAAEFPPFEVAHTETPSPLNPLGAKGIGESATVGSTPCGAERGRRRAQPPRRAPRRHAVLARAGVARHRGRPRGHPGRSLARAAGGVRIPPGAATLRRAALRDRRHRPLVRRRGGHLRPFAVGRYDRRPMKIAVCVKHVPCGTLRMRPDSNRARPQRPRRAERGRQERASRRRCG